MQIHPQKIVIASNNQGKVIELAEVLAPLQASLHPQSEFKLDSPEETGITFIENALLKARYASLHTGLPAIADDSGLVVDALAGAPGVYSARYAGDNANDEMNNQKLLQALTDTPENERSARYVCCLVYVNHPEDPSPIIGQGFWPGRILFAPQGTQGFGYDPLFYVPTHHCSAAELEPAVKNALSHRAQAMPALLAQFRNLYAASA